MGWVSVFQRFSISAFQRVFSRPGVGFVHSSLRQDASLEAGEGANRLTKHAPATRCRKNDGSTLANLPASDTPRVSLRSPVREYCTPGSVRGAPGNRCPYLDTIMRARDWAIIRPTRRWACKRVARPRPWPGWTNEKSPDDACTSDAVRMTDYHWQTFLRAIHRVLA